MHTLASNKWQSKLYKTLRFFDAIRVLELQPGQYEDPLVCQLVETRIGSNFPYEALSYVWAQYSGPAFLECNGQRIPITCNVEYALRQLRSIEEVRTLWIDQICINQADIYERGQQVDNMYKIFSRAQRVLMYLGKADIFPIWAEHAIREVGKLFETDSGREYVQQITEHDRDEPLEETGPTFLNINLDVHLSVAALTTIPYFKRVWTIQEAHAARRQGLIICGNERIEFSKLLPLLENVSPQASQAPAYIDHAVFDPSHRSVLSNIHVIGALNRMDKDTQPAKTSIFLLDKIRHCTATDNRDRIYSVYYFLPPKLRRAMGPPDYSLTSAELFHQLAATEIDLGNARHCLGAAGSSYQNLDLPSWVPDWTYGFAAGSACLSTIGHESNDSDDQDEVFAAGSSVPGKFMLSNRMRRQQLSLTAHLIDEIAAATQVLDFELRDGETTAPWLAKVKQNLTACFEIAGISKRYVSQDLSRSVGCSTLTASLNLTWPKGKLQAHKATDEELRRSFDQFEHALDLHSPNDWEYLLENHGLMEEDTLAELAHIDRYRMTLQLIPHGRRFFSTSTGFLGIGPPGMDESDVLAVIHGCVTPSVLRKSDHGKYTLVGECFAYGFMQGEALVIESAPACTITLR